MAERAAGEDGPSLLAALGGLPDAAVLVGPDGICLGANALVGRYLGDDAPRVGEPVSSPRWIAAVADGPGPVKWVGADGVSRWLSGTRSEAPSPSGTHALYLFRDVSAEVRDRNQLSGAAEVRRSLAARLDAVNERLSLSNAELQRFAGSVAHDLRSPLANVLGFTELLAELMDAGDEVRTREIVRRLAANAERANAMVGDLLAYARAVGVGNAAETVDLEAVVAWAVDALAEQLLPSDAVVDWSSLSPVLGNEAALRQVFFNLLENALRHGDSARRPEIRVFQVASDDPELVEVHVQDNGHGVPLERRERIFGMGVSEQAQGADDGDVPSTGIGLASCSAAVRAMGGEIFVTDRSDGIAGADFVVRLPHADVLDDALVFDGHRALLVDDDPDALHMLTLLGRSIGLEPVATAASVAEARTRMEELAVPPTVAVVDLELPDGDGLELVRWLRTRAPDLEAIVFSSHADDEARTRALAAGAVAFVGKGSVDDLVGALRRTVQDRAAGRGG